MELVLELCALIKDKDGETEYILAGQYHPSKGLEVLEQICVDICDVLRLNSEQNINEIGMAYRAFCMFWPMAILLFSSRAGDERRAWVQEQLRFIGKTTGFGMATFSAEMVDTFRPIRPIRPTNCTEY